MRSTILLFLGSVPLFAQEYFVSATTGQPSNNGTTTGSPFLTIQQAAAVMVPGDTCTIAGGRYRETVRPARSGTATLSITYRAATGAQVVISGADPLSAWTSDGGAVWKTTLPSSYFTSELGQSLQVLVDDVPLVTARWPNDSNRDPSRPVTSTLTSGATRNGNGPYTAVLTDSNLGAGEFVGARIWLQPSDIDGENSQPWSWTFTGFITARSGNQLTMQTTSDQRADAPRPGADYAAGGRYYLSELRSLLDANGEFFHDRQAGLLYVQMPGGDAPSNHRVEAKRRDYAFVLDGISYTTISGVSLLACTITTDAATGNRSANPNPSTHVTLDGITARYLNSMNDYSGHFMIQWGQVTGIVLSGTDYILRNSTLHYGDGNGVSLMGSRLKVLNNTITDMNCGAVDCGFIYTGWNATTYDSEIAWNTCKRAGRSGLMLRKMRNSSTSSAAGFVSRVHHNDISDWGMQDHDVGAFYTFGDSGTFVRIDHNRFHCDDHPTGLIMGAYWDYTRNWVFDHNVVFGVRKGINNTGSDNGANNTLMFNNSVIAEEIWGYPVSNDGAGCYVKNNLFKVSVWPNWQHWPVYGSNATVMRNLVWGNDPSKGTDSGTGLHGNDSGGSTAGMVDWQQGNLTLAAGSPAIDQGSAMSDVTIDGVRIPSGSWNDAASGTPDLGAYEYGQLAWVAGVTTTVTPPSNTPPTISLAATSSTSLGNLTSLEITINDVETAASNLSLTVTSTNMAVIPTANLSLSGSGSGTARILTFSGAAVGSTTLTVRVGDGQLNTDAVCVVTITALPSSATNGWRASYFNSINFSGPAVERIDAAIDFDWGMGSPASGITVDSYSVRWRGSVQPPVSGVYTFSATADDGVRVWVAGKLVINQWVDQGPTTSTGQVTLTQGTATAVEMEYYEHTGGAVAHLAWSANGLAHQIIPTAAVSPAMDGSIPGGWHGVDFGGATPAGTQVEDAGTWTITGGGADIWNSSDSFHFVSRRITGDAQVTARVVSLSTTDAWTKAGVMIRESTTADARHAFTCVTAANGIAFQRRLSPGGASSRTSGPLRSAPTWVRMTRLGDTCISSSSVDGSTWSEVRRDTITMGAAVDIGLAITSHQQGTSATAIFSDVTLVEASSSNN